jgi:predicted NBD/HSP70 family sugar kinase
MSHESFFHVQPTVVPPLDPGFRPAALANRRFREELRASGRAEPFALAVEADQGTIARHDLELFPESDPRAAANTPYVERILKFLLWQKGGWRIQVGGNARVCRELHAIYSKTGRRSFDCGLMAEVYGRPLVVETVPMDRVPRTVSRASPLGRHLDGCRIGFDLGASDRKVAAVQDGKVLYSEEVVWDPRGHADPQYHFDEIMAALKKAASFLPRVDAIGGSSAGVYVNNSVRVASLFRGVPPDLFEKRVRGLFLEIQKAWGGIPFEVINDGEVTALAGAMSLNVTRVLGLAFGSSVAAGYVDADGNIPGWLDELAFAPVDYNPGAPVDEWSGDAGCAVQYFPQVAVNRLAQAAGIPLGATRTVPERLKDVQALMEKGDPKARAVFETIGVYFGYTLPHYADFYDMEHVLILGRVTSGKGGDLILQTAQGILDREFPDLAERLKLSIPDEASRRVGQAIAAASLPELPKKAR